MEKEMKYRSIEEIREVVAEFEAGTISRNAWGHPEHLIVAYSYALEDENSAYDRMRTGIFNLLDAFGVDLSREMPYHETMTLFWIKTVAGFAASNPEMTVESVDKMIKSFGKRYPNEFYSEEVLMSDKARAEWVEPNLKQMDN